MKLFLRWREAVERVFRGARRRFRKVAQADDCGLRIAAVAPPGRATADGAAGADGTAGIASVGGAATGRAAGKGLPALPVGLRELGGVAGAEPGGTGGEGGL